MQFKTLTKPELLEICEEFGVDVSDKVNKNFILTELLENGVTESMYLAAHPEKADDYVEPEEDDLEDVVVEKPAPAKVKKQNQILILMQRNNPTFEIYGYRFTREHPFALVNEDDVDALFESYEGFRQATPKEAAEYYS